VNLRAIFYDLDGTLRIGRPTGRQFFADYAAELGLELSPNIRRHAAQWEHYYWAESSEKNADELNFPDERAFWINYSRRQLVELGATTRQAESLAPQISQHMETAYHPEDKLMDGLIETLAGLRAKGITLGVISNRHQPFRDYLRELGIDTYFDFSLAAGEISAWKPGKEIFLHALAQLNISPSESVYVGDNYFADVVGARNAGMNPILIDPDGLFDAPGCPVIQSHNQIFAYLERSELWPGNGK
jgi:HAD superfamily hydrolase (TIGR01549 family)